MRFVSRVRAICNQIAGAVTYQALGSAANFALNLYLVRALPPEHFGRYGIALAAALLLSGCGGALLTTQMIVALPDQELSDRRRFTVSMLVAVLLSCSGLALSSFLAALLEEYCPLIPNLPGDLIVGIALAASSLMCRDFMLRLAVSERKLRVANYINAAWAALIFAQLAAAHGLGIELDAGSAILFYVLPGTAATFIGWLMLSLPVKDASVGGVKAVFAQALPGGRWAALGVLVTWLQSQSYIYITALAAGASAVAVANAAKLFISPVLFLMPALGHLLLPRLSRERAGSASKLQQSTMWIVTALASVGTMYSLAAMALYEDAFHILLGEYYDIDALRLPVLLWFMVLVAQLTRSGASLAIQASRGFRSLTVLSAYVAVISVLCVAVLTISIGTAGAILGLFLGEILLAYFLLRHIRKLKNHV